jgi:RHS repeat-associated protein
MRGVVCGAEISVARGTRRRTTISGADFRYPSSLVQSLGARNITFKGFDALGRELSRGESSPSFAGDSTTSYDALGRLHSTLQRTSIATVAKWAFNYDALGNVLKLDDQVGTADATLSYLTTDRDQVCGVSYGGTPTSCNVQHDSFGNITIEATRSGSNKLKYFNSGDVRSIANTANATATFAYDPFGEVSDLAITSPTGTRHDRNFGAFITQRSQTSAQASTSYAARRFPGPGLSISRRGPQGSWVFQFSEPSGTRFTTDEKGHFLQDLRYAPFGQTTSTGVTAGTNTFTTEQWNEGDALDGFGLVQLGKRIYDPVIGRFLSRDPLLTPRTSATTNPYAFALNDPVNLSDPSGLDPNGYSIWASSNGASSSTDSAVAAGVLAAELFHYFGANIGNWFGSGSDRAAFDAARGMQTAIFQMGPTTTTPNNEFVFDVYRGFGGAIKDTVVGSARLAFDPRVSNELNDHPLEVFKAVGNDLIETDLGMLSGDPKSLGRGAGMLALGELGGEFGMETTSLTDAGFRAASIDEISVTLPRPPLLDKYLSGSGGRWGLGSTRLQNHQIASELESKGFTITGGAGRASEEWIPGPGGGSKGSTWVDITATRGGVVRRVQTVTTDASGAPTRSEQAAAARIRAAFPNDDLTLVPKNKLKK